VVIAGLVTVVAGGPVFALFFISVGAAAYREYIELVARIRPRLPAFPVALGYGAIVGFGLAALLGAPIEALFGVVTLAVVSPLAVLLLNPIPENAFMAWSLASSGSLYLGLPVYSAIAIRSIPSPDQSVWLSDLAIRLSRGWDATSSGLAWALVVILATWVGDTVAYFVGSTRGRTKFVPAISPNKTIEGAAGGLVGSMVISALAFQSFGLGRWWQGLIVGGVIGLAGQLGDLAESLLKRQAGVKDSGAMIPGHGGMLDRIDALLFAFPAGFVIAAGFERVGT
jgi:phosphatidate cytidylyltransferase